MYKPDALIAVSTCARPDEASYLLATLDALDREGASELPSSRKIVLSDGDLSVPHASIPKNWEVHETPGARTSSRRNMWGAFRLTIERNAAKLLFFEDDLLLCKNAVRYLCRLEPPPSMALVSFHDSKEFLPGTPFGMYRLPFTGRDGRGLFGSQCFMIPRGTVEYLAAQNPYSVWTSDLSCFSDRTLEVFLYMSRRWAFYAVHIPCLVRHRGAVSAAHPGKKLDRRHTTNFFDGPDADATSLRFFDAYDVPSDMPRFKGAP